MWHPFNGFDVLVHRESLNSTWIKVHWLVVLGLTALSDSISVYIGPFPKEKEQQKRKGRGE